MSCQGCSVGRWEQRNAPTEAPVEAVSTGAICPKAASLQASPTVNATTRHKELLTWSTGEDSEDPQLSKGKRVGWGNSPYIAGEREASLQSSRVVGRGSRTPHPEQAIVVAAMVLAGGRGLHGGKEACLLPVPPLLINSSINIARGRSRAPGLKGPQGRHAQVREGCLSGQKSARRL